MCDKAISEIVNNDNIPSPPGVALRLLELVQDPNVGLSDLTKVIGADPKLSAKLIDYCNSPLVRLCRETSSIQQAVMLLGTIKIRMLALSFSLMDTPPTPNSDFDFEKFWSQSLCTAIFAKCISEHIEGAPNEDFLLGLVLQLGLLGIQVTYPKPIDQSLGLEEQIAQEFEQYGFHRYDVGARLLEKWKFPESMVEFLEQYQEKYQSHDQKAWQFGIAHQFSAMLFDQNESVEIYEKLRDEAAQYLDLDEVKFEQVFNTGLQEWNEYSQILDAKVDLPSSIQELKEKANQMLVDLSLGVAMTAETLYEENKLLESKIELDVLTQVKNRHAYETEAQKILDNSIQDDQTVACLVIDIDHFKSVNDNYGHAIGDVVLKGVAECLKKNIRDDDQIYRIGGEEFVLLLSDCDKKTARVVAERLRMAVSSIIFKTGDSGVLRVTISTGVSWAHTHNCRPIDKLFEAADTLLYKAKNNGRNCCIFEFDGANVPA